MDALSDRAVSLSEVFGLERWGGVVVGRQVDPAAAERVMRAAGCVPLVPFPGSGVPWLCIHEPCGNEITPLYANVRRRGRACRACGSAARGASRREGRADAAVAVMRSAGFEPLEEYPGSAKPWRCVHVPCGEERTPSLNTVKANGSACWACSAKAAGRTVWTAESAEELFRAHLLVPLEPWPGSSSAPWKARHLVCGRVGAPRLGNVAAGQGPCRWCGQEATHDALRKDDAEAAKVMLAAGLEPLAPFPGVDHPWLCRHVACGSEVSPTFTNVKRGQGGCLACGARATALRLRMPEDEARDVMLGWGLTPLEPYPGSGRPWRCRHSCGREVSPTLSNVRVGRGVCRYCLSAFPYAAPALVYLVVDHHAVKIGICGPNRTRVDAHRRLGWKLAWTVELPSGDDAYNVEQAIVSWWRADLELDPAYSARDMPQTGYTETARWAEMHPVCVLDKVRQVVEELGLPNLSPKLGAFSNRRPAAATASAGAERALGTGNQGAQEALF